MMKPYTVSRFTFYTLCAFALSTSAMANTSTPILTDSSTQTITPSSNHTALIEAKSITATKADDLAAPTVNETDAAKLFNYQPIQESTAEFVESDSEPFDHNWRWADKKREDIQDSLSKWSNSMNGWFGEPDPQDPASASLRVVLDTRWVDDAITGSDVTFEPRIRGRLKLPVLERRLSLIIGDEELDEETFLGPDATGKSYTAQASSQNKILDAKKIRDDNASIALRWSRFGKKLGLDTDIDVGVRSLDDLFIKVDIDKEWYEGKKLRVSSDNFYRYGLDSKHYIRGGLSLQYGASVERFINNRTTIRYRNQDEDEVTDWSNDLRQVHYLGRDRRLDYGISTFGYLTGDKSTLNSYGPAISYRQPVWREWLFMQTELNYYNDKSEDKSHYPSALLRMEALF